MRKFFMVWICLMLASFSISLFVGCEWEEGTSEVSYSDTNATTTTTSDPVPTNGSPTTTTIPAPTTTTIVAPTTTTIATPTTTSTTGGPGGSTNVNIMDGEVSSTVGNLGSTYSGVTDNIDIVPGTFTLDAGSFHFNDDGSGNLVSNYEDVTGTITYETGVWAIDLMPFFLDDGTEIVLNYQYGTD